MKAIVAACALAVLWLGLAPSPARAANIADTFCPAAVPLLVTYGNVAKNTPNDAEKVLSAAKALQNAYHVCAESFVASNAIEPSAHYCQVREAQFAVAASRAEFVLKDYDESHADAVTAHDLADGIVRWRPDNTAIVSSNGLGGSSASHVGTSGTSNYHDTAQQILDTATQLLAMFVPASPAPAKP